MNSQKIKNKYRSHAWLNLESGIFSYFLITTSCSHRDRPCLNDENRTFCGFVNNVKNTTKIPAALLFCCLLLFCLDSANALELNTKYAVIIYKDDAQLRNFNQELYIGKLSYYAQGTPQTYQDEIKQKIDVIITRVQAVLDMKPANLKFKIAILDTEKEVTDTYAKLYGSETDFLAFYSVGKNTVYLSLENTNIKILSHEFGHAVIENYFDVSPPRKIHEVLAQFAEQHIFD